MHTKNPRTRSVAAFDVGDEGVQEDIGEKYSTLADYKVAYERLAKLEIFARAKISHSLEAGAPKYSQLQPSMPAMRVCESIPLSVSLR